MQSRKNRTTNHLINLLDDVQRPRVSEYTSLPTGRKWTREKKTQMLIQNFPNIQSIRMRNVTLAENNGQKHCFHSERIHTSNNTRKPNAMFCGLYIFFRLGVFAPKIRVDSYATTEVHICASARANRFDVQGHSVENVNEPRLTWCDSAQNNYNVFHLKRTTSETTRKKVRFGCVFFFVVSIPLSFGSFWTVDFFT